MTFIIRQEKPADYQSVAQLIEAAFRHVDESDHKEQLLVEKLRKSEAFIPTLSLVAEMNDKVVGHILLTKIKIKSKQQTVDSLALAPVSVLPEHQKQGIGSRLIKAAHEKAAALGYESIIVLGHADYYPRFGYTRADTFGIQLPFDAPKENCMAIALTENGLKDSAGIVEYPKPFTD